MSEPISPIGQLLKAALAGAALSIPLGIVLTLGGLIAWGFEPVLLRAIWLLVLILAAAPMVRAILSLWRMTALETGGRQDVIDVTPMPIREPLFLPARTNTPQAVSFDSEKRTQEQERRAAELKHAQDLGHVIRDLIEGSHRGLTRQAWAGRTTPSGLYVSQALWAEAIEALKTGNYLLAGGPGGSHALAGTPPALLDELGLNTLEEERRTGRLRREGSAQAVNRLLRIG